MQPGDQVLACHAEPQQEVRPMTYSCSKAVYVEIKGLTESLLSELKEFLRVAVIIPVGRPVTGEATDKDSGKSLGFYYSGCFSRSVLPKIEGWLEEKGLERINREAA